MENFAASSSRTIVAEHVETCDRPEMTGLAGRMLQLGPDQGAMHVHTPARSCCRLLSIGHLQSDRNEDPTPLVTLPTGHAVQEDWPGGEYLFSAQYVHEGDLNSANLPPGHLSQELPFPGL
jgi:hypothetical protein